MTRSPSYLCRNQYGYCFRMRVPHDLQSCVGRKELKRSLETGYLPQARSKAMIFGGQYKQLFRWVRYQHTMGKMTEQEIQEVVDLFVEYIGDADISGERAILDSRAFPPEQLRDKINKARDAVLHYTQAADTGDYSGGIRVDLVVDDLLQHTVKNPPEKGSAEYKRLCRKVAGTLRDKWDAYQQHHTKRLAGVHNAVSDGVHVAQVENEADEGPSISLSQLITEFEKQKVESGNWQESTVRNHRPKMNAMLRYLGGLLWWIRLECRMPVNMQNFWNCCLQPLL